MNPIDVYDFEQSAPTAAALSQSNHAAEGGDTSVAATSSATQPTLNEEVQQAWGTLGRFWGGFRQQSAAALTSARRDFGQVVEQAQKELGKLSTNATSPQSTPRPSTDAATEIPENAEKSSNIASNDDKTTDDPESTTAEASETPQHQSTRSTSLFSFIQSSLPPTLAQNLSSAPATIQSTFQRTLSNPEVQNIRAGIVSLQETVQANPTVRNLQSSVQSFDMQSSVQSIQTNVANLRSTVQSTLPKNAEQAKEGIKIVEGFVLERGEEFWKGAGEFFREAVKIVPPPPSGEGGGGAIWDGSDVWLFEDLGGEASTREGTLEDKGKGKAAVGEGIAVSRTAALLKKLREEAELVRADPETGDSKDTYLWFIEELEKKGGTVGSDAWTKKCNSEESMFEELGKLKTTLVPAEMDETTFWKRYWFRAWQIRQAEEKRKALLEATVADKEEDFSWEDEEDADTTPAKSENQTPLNASTSTLTQSVAPKVLSKPIEAKSTGDASSPRESEDSYDLVGTKSGNASGTMLAAASSIGASLPTKEKEKEKVIEKKGNNEEEDDEEDEEDEDDEEDDDDEEGEEEEDEEDDDEEGEGDSDWE